MRRLNAKYTNPDILDNFAKMLDHVKSNPENVTTASDRLKDDEFFIAEILRVKPDAFKFVKTKFKSDPQYMHIMRLAVSRDSSLIKTFSNDIQERKQAILDFAFVNPYVYPHLLAVFQDDEMVKNVVFKWNCFTKFIKEPFRFIQFLNDHHPDTKKFLKEEIITRFPLTPVTARLTNISLIEELNATINLDEYMTSSLFDHEIIETLDFIFLSLTLDDMEDVVKKIDKPLIIKAMNENILCRKINLIEGNFSNQKQNRKLNI